MSAIHDFDDAMVTITVQPGVAFSQADRFVVEHGSRHFLAQIGASPDRSLTANGAERGHGNGIYGDRANAVAGLVALSPKGDAMRTGYRRQGADRLAKTHRSSGDPDPRTFRSPRMASH